MGDSMEKNVTIKTIAQEVGVSTGTVHRALYGKKGVSAELREKIQELCSERGYRANTAASALKRGSVRIVAAFPGVEEHNRYFYSNVWRGFHRLIDELGDYNLDVVELSYYPGTAQDQCTVLERCFQQYSGTIDALLTVGHFDAACKDVVRTYSGKGIPVFLACDDTEDCGRVACVQGNYDMTGRMTAELLSSQLLPGSTVFLCTGDKHIPSHYQTVEGFEHYLGESAAKLNLVKIDGYADEEEFRSRLRQLLTDCSGTGGAFSVSARLSVILAEEVESLSKAGDIRVVASDLFRETIDYMERGVVRNIVYKNPAQQAYQAAKVMTDYVLKAYKCEAEIQYVESLIIFRSSLDMYIE